jgi:hypothetical protein
VGQRFEFVAFALRQLGAEGRSAAVAMSAPAPLNMQSVCFPCLLRSVGNFQQPRGDHHLFRQFALQSVRAHLRIDLFAVGIEPRIFFISQDIHGTNISALMRSTYGAP